jgi:hypothetical protein
LAFLAIANIAKDAMSPNDGGYRSRFDGDKTLNILDYFMMAIA